MNNEHNISFTCSSIVQSEVELSSSKVDYSLGQKRNYHMTRNKGRQKPFNGLFRTGKTVETKPFYHWSHFIGSSISGTIGGSTLKRVNVAQNP